MMNRVIFVLILILVCSQVWAGGINNPGSSASSGSISVPLGLRAPTSTDDNTLGYNVGSFWNAEINGIQQQWVMQSNGTGTANWQQLPSSNQPICDAVSGAVGCYGVYRMKAAYAGNAFLIERSSDSTTLSIGFDVNGIAQWSAVDNFCAGTTCGLETWYDQSGNGYDVTQATFANMPPIFNDKVGVLRAPDFSTQFSAAQTLLTNSSLPITTRNTFTSIAIINPLSSSNSTAGQGLFALNSASPNWFYYTDLATSNGQLRISPGSGNVSTGAMVASNPSIFLTVNNSGSTTTTQNNVVTGPTVTGFSSTASTGLILGGNNVYQYYQGAIAAFVIYNSALSATQQQLLQQLAYRDSGVRPQATVNLVFYASSLICCNGGTQPPNEMFPNAFQQDLNNPVRLITFGESGVTLAGLNAIASTVLGYAKVTGMKNVVVEDGASNDFAGNTSITPATVYGYQQTACSLAHTAGYLCYTMTLFPRQGTLSNGQTAAGFEADRQGLTTLERANLPGDGLIDPAADPTVGPMAAALNTSYFLGDFTHLDIPLGQSFEAAIYARGLKGIIQ